ncbi:MAG: CoA pyrophosphatase [bacterium]
MTSNELKSLLLSHRKQAVNLKDFRPSAVLLPLFLKENEEHFLFTVRNDQVRHHKGEVCFPGGAYDETDSSLQVTALRECEEEIGIREKDVEILGELDDLITPTFYRITPFVGRIPYPYPLKINHREIAELLEVPVAHFQDEKNLRVEYFDYFGEGFEMPFYKWKQHTIWGATARMVRQFVSLLKEPKGKNDELKN